MVTRTPPAPKEWGRVRRAACGERPCRVRGCPSESGTSEARAREAHGRVPAIPCRASRGPVDRRYARRYAFCMTVQLVTRVPDDVAAAIDELVREGVFESRSEAVRAGLGELIERRRRVAIGRAIADGYRRLPQADDDLTWSDAASAAMIAEESW
jgi:Arc/MetJ-type ribon-helix-helix transcriptional regulator